MMKKNENQMRVEFSRGLIVRFLLTVLFAQIIACVVHVFVLDQLGKVQGGVVHVSYLVQLILSILSFLIISKVSEKKGEQAGFYFLGLSALKFLVYVVGFRLYFIQDGSVSREEYAIFFIPYIVAFIIEVTFLVHALNKTPLDLEKVISYEEEEE